MNNRLRVSAIIGPVAQLSLAIEYDNDLRFARDTDEYSAVVTKSVVKLTQSTLNHKPLTHRSTES